jgi:putative flippase GtrA
MLAGVRTGREFLRDIRSPRWGVAGQGLRFLMSGGVVALVYAATTTLLHAALGLPFQLALVLGYLLSLAVHYTLQRLFVWRHDEEFALRAHSQLARYMCVSVSQYALTAVATAKLPRLLSTPVESVYLVTIFTLALMNFAIFRTRVFHPASDRAAS